MLRAIREIQPDWVVGENVAGILSMVQPGSETALGREESLFGEVDRKEYCIGRNTLSKQCVTTLNVKDISSNRLLFRLVPSERRTEETVSSLLPTVQTQGLKVCNENGKTTFYPVGLLPTPRAVEVVEHPMKAAARTKDRTGTKLNNLSSGAAFGLLPTPMASDATTGAIIGKNDQFVTTRNGTPRRINQNGQNGSVGLARMVRLLPTPNAREADKYSKKYNPNSQMGTALTAMAVNGMLPTPAARDYQPSVSPQALKRKMGNEDGCSVQPAGNVRRASFAERWKNFPTQSPVCSRDDGISTRLDGIAFSKWRQESIKAYGNAIVPQVMYEIFQAIQETYNQ